MKSVWRRIMRTGWNRRATMLLALSVHGLTVFPAGATANPDAVALFDRGTTYMSPAGARARDPQQACDLFEQSASADYPPAQYNLGLCYQFGDGRPRDLVKATRLFEGASEQGYAKASLNLAANYLYEPEVVGPRELAVHILQDLLAEGELNRADNGRAAFLLGTAFYSGLGIARDGKRAIELLENAGTSGNLLAQALLFEIYSGRGDFGGSADPVSAEYWRDAFRSTTALGMQTALGMPQTAEAQSIDSAIAYLRRRGMGLKSSVK